MPMEPPELLEQFTEDVEKLPEITTAPSADVRFQP